MFIIAPHFRTSEVTWAFFEKFIITQHFLKNHQNESSMVNQSISLSGRSIKEDVFTATMLRIQ